MAVWGRTVDVDPLLRLIVSGYTDVNTDMDIDVDADLDIDVDLDIDTDTRHRCRFRCRYRACCTSAKRVPRDHVPKCLNT